MKFKGLLALVFFLLVWADHFTPITVWPTVPFTQGQDQCQFQDACASSKMPAAVACK